MSETTESVDFVRIKFSGDVVEQEEFNQKIRDWAEQTTKIFVANVERMCVKGKTKPQITRKDGTIEKKLSQSIGFFVNKKDQVAERIRFSFERHGVFVEKGKGATPREAKEWFNPTIDKKMEELADIVQEYGVSLNIRKLGIKIK